MPRGKRQNPETPQTDETGESPLKKHESQKGLASKVSEGAASLNGTPPVRLPPWKETLSVGNISTMKLGEVDKWGNLDNRVVVDSDGNNVDIEGPPAVVTMSYLSGLGRAAMGQPVGPKNQFMVELMWGNLPQSVKDKNPQLEQDHLEFISMMKEFETRTLQNMFDTGKYATQKRKSSMNSAASILSRIHPGWPENRSILKHSEIAAILESKFDSSSEEIDAMIVNSGLLAMGGAI
jgi:hypothetical protein